jgi:multisubunit Na+/H+ antiporter MnhG subunit
MARHINSSRAGPTFAAFGSWVMRALGVVVLLLWVVAPVVLYQIGRFTYGLTLPRRRRVRKAKVTEKLSRVPAARATPRP